MSIDPDDLIKDHSDKLKSILARRGSHWGFSGNITPLQLRQLAEVIASHIVSAAEIWQASYRGSDRLFYITDDRVAITSLDGIFESAWRATLEQLSHYRTGVKIK